MVGRRLQLRAACADVAQVLDPEVRRRVHGPVMTRRDAVNTTVVMTETSLENIHGVPMRDTSYTIRERTNSCQVTNTWSQRARPVCRAPLTAAERTPLRASRRSCLTSAR